LSVTVTQTVNVSREPEAPQSPLDLVAIEDAIKRAQQSRGRPRCKGCGWGRSGSDRGTLRRSLCVTCEIRWLDRIVHRLTKKVGRKAAIAALKAVAK
jgi:hypothetical protein